MNILLIGGSGVISTSVSQQLIDRGDDLTLLNRGRTPVRFKGEFKQLTGDRLQLQEFERIIADSGPWDCVIDMICSDPEHAESLVKACKNKTEQLVFCSTTNVYPKPADSYPVREDHRLGAEYKNGIDKAACEQIHRMAEKKGNFNVTIIRPGHTYAESGSVLNILKCSSSFLDRFKQGKPLIVHGDGNGLWSALHADDVARIFVATTGNPVAFGKTYNACGEEWMTWNQYHQRIAAALDVETPELVHIPVEVLAELAPERAGHCQRSLQYPGIYDMSMARNDFGFKQQIPFVPGTKLVIQWLEENEGIEPWQSDPLYDQILDKWKLLGDRL